MTIDDIHAMWAKDAKIERDELADESMKIPQLHSKYLKIYSQTLPKPFQKPSKIDPKGSQNEAKSDTKPKQPLQDALGGLRRQIPPLSWSSRGPTWRPKSNKNWKKTT